MMILLYGEDPIQPEKISTEPILSQSLYTFFESIRKLCCTIRTPTQVNIFLRRFLLRMIAQPFNFISKMMILNMILTIWLQRSPPFLSLNVRAPFLFLKNQSQNSAEELIKSSSA